MTSHYDRRHESRLSTAGDYEREAEQTRRRLAENLDELSDRLTPGQVFDEMLTYSRAGGGTFFRAFSNAMRENPLPSLLIGAGCMMFLSEKMGLRPGGLGNGGRPMMATPDDPYGVSGGASRVSDAAGRMTGSAASSARSAAGTVQSSLSGAAEAAQRQASNVTGAVADRMTQTAGAVGDTMRQTATVGDTMTQTAATVGDTVRQTAATVGDTVKQTTATVGDTVEGATDAVRATTHDLRDQASGAVEQMRRGAQNAAGAMRDTAASMGGRLADTADRTRRQAAEAVRHGRDSATSFITEQPLLCAAIGVAVGAALASILPSTDAENQWMGEASDAVKGGAGHVGSDALESAKNVASKVEDRAQTALKEEGFSPTAVAEAARSLGEGIQQGAMKQPTTGTGPQEGLAGSSGS